MELVVVAILVGIVVTAVVVMLLALGGVEERLRAEIWKAQAQTVGGVQKRRELAAERAEARRKARAERV